MSVRTKLDHWFFRLLRLPLCEAIEGFAYDFLEGNLDPQVHRLVERHLKLCPPCKKFMASYRRVRAAAPRDPVPPLDPRFTEHLLKLFQA